MYKVVKIKHNDERALELAINEWMEKNEDHTLVTQSSIDNRGKMHGTHYLSFVTFKSNFPS